MVYDWVSVAEAAELSGYEPDYIRKLVRAGKIKARKVVTVWTVDRQSLLTYLDVVKRRGEKRGPKKGV